MAHRCVRTASARNGFGSSRRTVICRGFDSTIYATLTPRTRSRRAFTPKVASERLGHSKVAITLDFYSHVLPNMQADAAAIVDGALMTALNKRK